ncbi:hypothetical protein [Moritella yayanosii]|uniref:Uncharacterized protein n=1 Tax=Moritella yayanosii TaxID=69539 RepID=A0A330LN78_9GAMM|nr:hypothetical protein [Moritella yayanosii]SQD78320.1 conserved protein of unknown function [Moritella yayanosii]
MIAVETDGFRFEFTDALEAFVFDEKDKSKPTFHGAPMKGVDIVAEFDEAYVYIEIKDYQDEFASAYDIQNFESDDELKEKRRAFKWLKNYLKYKYRDSYLYRHAEDKVEKPIHYICLLNFDNALNLKFTKSLKQELPIGRKSRRWNKSLAQSCRVLNIDRWNEHFPKWPVSKIAP